MNWTAGILAFVLLWVPVMIIMLVMHKRDKEIEREYKQRLRDIEKHYGVKL